MSKISLTGNPSGTGTFTISSPDSSTDRTLDLPDAAGTIQVSGNPISGTTGSFSGDLSFNSGYGSAAVAYGCRAWVNFAAGTSPSIRASGNVSSVTRPGTGIYTVNLATAMPDANYSVVGSDDNYGLLNTAEQSTHLTSAFNVYSYNNSFSLTNSTNINLSVFR